MNTPQQADGGLELALDLARHWFLPTCDLPRRWAGRRHFVVLDTHWDAAQRLLATWDAWRRDPARCARLHFVALAPQWPAQADLARAWAGSPLPDLAARLLQQWPPATHNLHTLDLEEDGRVQLTLALGDPASELASMRADADAIFFASGGKPWQARALKVLGRLAAKDALLASADATAGERAALLTAGFAVTGVMDLRSGQQGTTARFAPRFVPHRMPTAAVPDATHAVVVGAGLAGAAVAQALARQGLQVTVLEQHGQPATQASGNPGGIFHGTFNADDGVYARLFRAAALHASREYSRCTASHTVPGQAGGLLRLETNRPDRRAMQALLDRVGLPADYVRALSREEACALAGVPLPGPAWFYPGGGWVAPGAWVAHTLKATPGVHLHCNTAARRLVRDGHQWCLQDAQGRPLASAPIVVLAQAAGVAPMLAELGHEPWPVQSTRGQVTYWATDAPAALTLPVAGDGYALPLPGGLLCGATRQHGDDDSSVRSADHQANLARLARLTGLVAPADPAQWLGRVGWRLQADDSLPIAGALPLAHMPAQQRMDQPRLLPREPGLFALTALGARGLTMAPLLARLVAAQATGTPWPMEQDLADALDPARWRVRAARAAGGSGTRPEDQSTKAPT